MTLTTREIKKQLDRIQENEPRAIDAYTRIVEIMMHGERLLEGLRNEIKGKEHRVGGKPHTH